jgi:hypothetical protein
MISSRDGRGEWAGSSQQLAGFLQCVMELLGGGSVVFGTAFLAWRLKDRGILKAFPRNGPWFHHSVNSGRD